MHLLKPNLKDYSCMEATSVTNDDFDFCYGLKDFFFPLTKLIFNFQLLCQLFVL